MQRSKDAAVRTGRSSVPTTAPCTFLSATSRSIARPGLYDYLAGGETFAIKFTIHGAWRSHAVTGKNSASRCRGGLRPGRDQVSMLAVAKTPTRNPPVQGHPRASSRLLRSTANSRSKNQADDDINRGFLIGSTGARRSARRAAPQRHRLGNGELVGDKGGLVFSSAAGTCRSPMGRVLRGMRRAARSCRCQPSTGSRFDRRQRGGARSVAIGLRRRGAPSPTTIAPSRARCTSTTPVFLDQLLARNLDATATSSPATAAIDRIRPPIIVHTTNIANVLFQDHAISH